MCCRFQSHHLSNSGSFLLCPKKLELCYFRLNYHRLISSLVLEQQVYKHSWHALDLTANHELKDCHHIHWYGRRCWDSILRCHRGWTPWPLITCWQSREGSQFRCCGIALNLYKNIALSPSNASDRVLGLATCKLPTRTARKSGVAFVWPCRRIQITLECEPLFDMESHIRSILCDQHKS